MSDLVTGEAVAVELRLARLPSRAMAFSIDLLVLAAIGVPLLVVTGLAVGSADPALASALVLVVLVAVLVGVPVLVETLTRGRSLGKLALGLRVVRDDGGPTRFRHALARGLAGFFVDFWVTSGAGAIICSLLNSRGKRVGDLLAGTVVVRDRAPSSTAASIPPPPSHLAAWAARTQQATIPDDLVMSARTYLTRLPQLDAASRDRVGAQLATAVSAYVSPAAPPGTTAWGYLAAVLGERSRREAARYSEAPSHDGSPSGPDARPGHPPSAPLQQHPRPQPAPLVAPPSRRGGSGFAPPS